MANILSNTGITTGNLVQPEHVIQSIDAFTGAVAYDISLSGSFNMTGSINGQPGIINPLTASFAQTASYVTGSIFAGANSVVSASYALTASHALNGGGGGSITVKDESIILTSALTSLDFVGSGVTATNVGNDVTINIAGAGGSAFPFTGSAQITGSLGVTGSISINNLLYKHRWWKHSLKYFNWFNNKL
jgi:hypothetical protein